MCEEDSFYCLDEEHDEEVDEGLIDEPEVDPNKEMQDYNEEVYWESKF